MEKIRESSINDVRTDNGSLCLERRVIGDALLLRIEMASESKCEWDLLEIALATPGAEAFRPLSEGGRALVLQAGPAGGHMPAATPPRSSRPA